MHRNSLALIATLMLVGACCNMPRNFVDLPLSEKMSVYERHLRECRLPWDGVTHALAWHGWEAADMMAQYLDGRSIAVAPMTAIQTIDLVQSRGCSLKGTAAEVALRKYLASGKASDAELAVGTTVLREVEEDRWSSTPVDGLPGGPCEGHPPRPERFDHHPQ